MAKPWEFGIPRWFLNRQRDISDGQDHQLTSVQVDTQLRQDLERWKKIRIIKKKQKRNEKEKENLKCELREFFEKLRFLFHIDVIGKDAQNKLADIDIFFNSISLTIEQFRAKQNISDPELACLLSWLEKMYSSFEKLLAIKESRTPKTLTIFLDWALVIGVLILTPQFAEIGIYGVFTSFLIMSFLIILIKVQKILEYPFGKNMDHIDLRMRNKTVNRII